jgi:nickel-type superoxide dismutase maturation protease
MHYGLTIPRDPASKPNGWRRLATAVLATAAGLTALTAAARSVVRRVEVVGASMAPALRRGDRLLVVRRRPVLLRPSPLRPGDVVAVPDPRSPGRLLVKRVRWVDNRGVVVRGDNSAASTDSRTFGPVPEASVWGVARYRYAPADRAGVIARGPR